MGGFLFEQVVNGIITGSMYALIAAGMTMIFGVLRAINFAHGEYYMLGTFGAWLVHKPKRTPPPPGWGLLFFISAPAAGRKSRVFD